MQVDAKFAWNVMRTFSLLQWHLSSIWLSVYNVLFDQHFIFYLLNILLYHTWLYAAYLLSLFLLPLRHNGRILRLKSPVSRLFTQPFIQAQVKENIKAERGIRRWPVNPRTNG